MKITRLRRGSPSLLAGYAWTCSCSIYPIWSRWNNPEVEDAHGVPDRPLVSSARMRRRIGWPEQPTLLTFGLLSPGKGIETAIKALPDILERVPNVRYVLLGATHPALLAREGERYRDGLVLCARRLGVDHALHMENRYIDDTSLCDARRRRTHMSPPTSIGSRSPLAHLPMLWLAECRQRRHHTGTQGRCWTRGPSSRPATPPPLRPERFRCCRGSRSATWWAVSYGPQAAPRSGPFRDRN